MVGNLIAKNSVLAKWCEIKSVHVTRVNIYDRAGNISWRAKWTPDEVQAIADAPAIVLFKRNT